LSGRQITYALDDVIYLAQLYPQIKKRIADEGRTDWLDEEYAKSTDPATYVTNPEDAWRRLKLRNMRSPALLRLMHLAAWRETEAQQRDLPRNRVLRDETLIDLAGSNPQTTADFAGIRNFPGGKDGKLAAPVLKILHKVAALPDTALPVPLSHSQARKPPAAIMELLRVLLKHVSDEQNIAPRLLASADDLELLARDDNAPIRALSGWRREVFGATALQLKNGEIALAVKNGRIRLITDSEPAA
jgi:ribonuclease D